MSAVALPVCHGRVGRSFGCHGCVSRAFRAACVLALLLFGGMNGSSVFAQPAEPLAPEHQQADEAAREGLEGNLLRERFPWYDSDADELGRINVQSELKWEWTWWEWMQSVWSDFWNWLQEFNFDIDLSWLGIDASFSFFQLLGWLAAALLLAAVIYLLTKLYHKSQAAAPVGGLAAAGGETDSLDPERVEALPLPARRHADDLLAEARRLYEQGAFAEAIVYLFSHQLVQLDRGHVIRLSRGKTNRQYLREIAPRRPLQEVVEQTMVAFEDVFFGNYPLDRGRFEACWTRLPQFDQLVKEA